MSQQKTKPLSPHITIYKPQISSVLSIMHRASGICNFVGLSALLWWIVAVVSASEPPANGMIWKFFNTWYGVAVLAAFSFSLYFHFCTGIRHLFWDVGKGFELKDMARSGSIAVFMAFALTGFTWFIIFNL